MREQVYVKVKKYAASVLRSKKWNLWKGEKFETKVARNGSSYCSIFEMFSWYLKNEKWGRANKHAFFDIIWTAAFSDLIKIKNKLGKVTRAFQQLLFYTFLPLMIFIFFGITQSTTATKKPPHIGHPNKYIYFERRKQGWGAGAGDEAAWKETSSRSRSRLEEKSGAGAGKN